VDFAGNGRMDGEETRIATHQRYELVTFIRCSGSSRWANIKSGLPDIKCALAARMNCTNILRQAGPGRARARSANDEGRKVHDRVRRMSRQLRHRAGDDGKRRVPSRRQPCKADEIVAKCK